MNVVVSVDPPRVAGGGAVNLTCSCAANPAADNYTWYKRSSAPGSSSLVWVGSGQLMSLLSMDPSHTGLYVCQAVNRLGGNHSTEVLLTVEVEGGVSHASCLHEGLLPNQSHIFHVTVCLSLFRRSVFASPGWCGTFSIWDTFGCRNTVLVSPGRMEKVNVTQPRLLSACVSHCYICIFSTCVSF